MLLDFTLKANIHCFSLTPNFKKIKLSSHSTLHMFTHVASMEICVLKKAGFRKHCSSHIQLIPSPYLNTSTAHTCAGQTKYTKPIHSCFCRAV